MDENRSIQALAALAQSTRLAVFRLLVREGPAGLAAGVLAERLEVQPATLSFHLAQLERAGLLVSQRRSRQIIYAADFAGMRGLVDFLLADCCGGRPEICAGLAGSLVAAGRRDKPAPAA
ncbi:helix-turn-helix transcriptional regulator [Pelagibius litoralis]|uniref:Helix-turn-helix transcriptional regulator n=1 Tax=Pelagibius litoralis TaxID=374515 RepID=A0A967F0A6_9PROT|nr:metalloregulator ArsR/SmtB family transcription factor [Pelagibius litoralis]NIA70667.1 helix-turn-helix transcriptional regulator [Pelagibius litoralis]